MHWLFDNWQSLAWSAGLLVVAVVVGLLVHRVVFALFVRLAHRTRSQLDDAFGTRLRAPLRLLVPLVAVQLVDSSLRLPPSALQVLTRATTLAFIAAAAWLCIRLLDVLETALLARYPEAAGVDATAKRVATQLHILRRVLVGVVVVVAGAVMLLTFPRVRAVGASLLASAGLVALVAGIALRPALANLIAGVHIAISRPININDVVVVEGEWGRIEEITLTYVVVRIWDLRRLVLPISYFTEKPFQNWTRGSPEIIGTAFVHADYRVPVEVVRQELLRILQASPRWDGKTWALQVTQAGEWTVELRAIMSAADASTAWDLRCEVREKLVDFLQREHPASLPRRRSEQGPLADLSAGPGPGPDATPASRG
jgi:small-conductance mechanosensitive channel